MACFQVQTKIFFGADRHSDLHAWLHVPAKGRLAAFIDDVLTDLPVLSEILEGYRHAGWDVDRIPVHLRAEPDYDLLDGLAGPLRRKPYDLMLGFGGGSLMDLAKGIAILATNPGAAVAYRGMDKVQHPPVPLILYPSTAGTGSEVTWTASFVDRDSMQKLGINGRHVAPLAGVLEPALVASCPSSVTTGSGLDAMVHALEAVTAKTANAISSRLGLEAFALLFANLKDCVRGGASWTHWAQMQLGAYLAGIAMMNVGGGPASGISYPLGVHYGVPHGFAGGVLLPHVIAWNVDRGYAGYAPLYDRLSGRDLSLTTDKEKSRAFVSMFRSFYDDIRAPCDFRQWHCHGQQAVEMLTEYTMSQRSLNLALNPIPFGRQDLVRFLSRILLVSG